MNVTDRGVSERIFFTAASIVYTGAMYAGSGWLRQLASQFRRAAGDHVSLAVTCGLIIVLGGLLYLGRPPIRGYRRLPLALLLCGYGLALWYLRMPEERLHLLQYGLLTFLVAKALPERLGTVSRSLLTIGLVTLAGIGDELVQACRPNRVADIRDVVINFVSAVLAERLLAVTSGAGRFSPARSR